MKGDWKLTSSTAKPFFEPLQGLVMSRDSNIIGLVLKRGKHGLEGRKVALQDDLTRWTILSIKKIEVDPVDGIGWSCRLGRDGRDTEP